MPNKKDDRLTKMSKFLSLVLRHNPQEIGMQLDRGGWADVKELLLKMPGMTADLLDSIVDTDEKKRYQFNQDKTLIRAVQGHSLPVDLSLTPKVPPSILYHGTAARFLDSIMYDGITKQSRQFVHLSADAKTAREVGARHGSPVVLAIDAETMHQAGIKFYQADNGVWLTSIVVPKYLRKL